MIWTILAVVCIAVLPWLLGKLVERVKVLSVLGLVFVCYAAGLLLSFLFNAVDADMSLVSTLYSVLVMTAIPLVLFSANLPTLKKLAKPMLISFCMGSAAVLIVGFVLFFAFRDVFPESRTAAEMVGMIVGGYTGGTPNSFAVGAAMNAGDTITLFQTGDIITGGIYFLLLISVLPRLAGKILKPYTPLKSDLDGDMSHYTQELSGGRGTVSSIVKSVLLALACVLVAVGVSLLLPVAEGDTRMGNIDRYTGVIMFVVTTLGVVLSFSKKVRAIPNTFASGQYLILMFSVGMGMCFNLEMVQYLLPVICMELLAEFLTVSLHMLFARLGHIDRDTMLITSAASVFSPAFIIPVARALKNDEIILSGILCGILGYAIGNYLGLGMGMLLLTL